MTTFNNGSDQSNQEGQGQGNQFESANAGDNQNNAPEGVNVQYTTEQIAALVKRDTNAQSHIVTLETETADLKTQMVDMQAKLDQANSVSELLEQQESNTAPVNVDDIVAQATQRITDATTAQALKTQQESNFEAVANTLSERYGADKVDEAVKAACAENGMGFEDMVQLAKSNPKAALKLCDVVVKAEAQPSSASSINTNAVLGQFDQQDQTPKVNVMELRTDKARIDDFQRRMDAGLKKYSK